MRFLRLDLTAFGPFSGLSLNLSQGEQGLHLVYGPNEAGKSSTLRAITQLLYGMPQQSPDDFLHPYADLRIGARLLLSDGQEMECIRRKGRNNTLRGPDDYTPVDEALFKRYLAGLSQDAFTHMFGLNHGTLVAGGKEIISGQGDLGRLLFSAGAGLENLRQVEQELKERAEAIYKPRGSVQPLGKALANHRDIQKQIRETQLSSRAYLDLKNRLDETRTARQELVTEMRDLDAERTRLRRIHEALPLLGERAALLQELGSLPDPEALLARAESIRALVRELGSHAKALRDRSGLMGEHKGLMRDMQSLLSQLPGKPALEEAQAMIPDAGQAALIRELAQEVKGLREKASATEENRLVAEQAIQALRNRPEMRADLHDPDRLQRISELCDSLYKTRDKHQRAAQDLDREQDVVTRSLSRQTFWTGALEELTRLVLPLAEDLEQYDKDLEKAANRVEKHRDKLEELDKAIARESLTVQLAEKDLPATVQDLTLARQARDEGWRLVRQAWESGKGPAEHGAEFTARFDKAADLAQAFEYSLEQSDDIADTLRLNADRIAEKDRREQALALLRQERNQTLDLKQEAAQALGDVQERWQALWASLAIQPAQPRQMLTWREGMKTLAERAARVLDMRRELERLEQTLEQGLAELGQALTGLDEAQQQQGKESSLDQTLARAKTLAENGQKALSLRQELGNQLHGQEQLLNQATTRTATARQELTLWQENWEAALTRLGLDGRATPAQAEAVLTCLETLRRTMEKAESHSERIQGIDADYQSFSSRVQALATDVGDMARDIAQANADPMQQAETLGNRLEKARELKELDKRIRTYSLDEPLERFMETAGNEDPDTLEPRIRDLDTAIQDLGETIKEKDREIGGLGQELSAMDGNDRAANLAGEAQAVLAEIEGHAQEYARLTLARNVLNKAVDSYRKKNRGPLLKRTEELFSCLTLGAYSGLRTDFGDKGEELTALSSQGDKTVRLEEMSDGTADQLYLAVRLASLESWLASNEPMPFIADDILLNFDDDRARAALKILAELSAKTQVIFFTHHRHLRDLAQETLGPEVLFRLELG